MSDESNKPEEASEQETRPKRRRRDFQPLWWAQFEWQWWLTNADVRRLTKEQRGAFMDVWAMTHGTKSPGVMTEEDVRAWAGYSTAEWKHHREAFKRLFTVTRSAKWLLTTVRDSYEEGLRAYRIKHRVAMAGVAKRRELKELATTGCTDGARTVQQGVLPGVGPDVQQDSRRDRNMRSKTVVPETERVPRGREPQPRPGSEGEMRSVGDVLARIALAPPSSGGGS